MLLIGKDTLKVLEARALMCRVMLVFFLGAGDFRGKVLRESRVKHLMVPLLPDSSWEFDDTFLPSEAAAPLVFSTNGTLEAFSVRRLPGSRTVRGLMITSGKGLFKGSIVLLFLRTRDKRQ